MVALDGGYVHSSQQTSRKDGWFEAGTGTSTPGDGGPAQTFAYVQTYDAKPKRRLHELLRSQGMQDNQQVVFLTGGGEDIRDIPSTSIPGRALPGLVPHHHVPDHAAPDNALYAAPGRRCR